LRRARCNILFVFASSLVTMKKMSSVFDERSFSKTIEKIQAFKDVRPSENWVVSCRTKLAFRLEIERKTALLNQDVFTLRELFSFMRVWQPKMILRPLYSLIIAFGVILGAGGLTALAATKSLPGSPLYPLKIAIEKARLVAVYSDDSRIRLHSDIMVRRMAELQDVVASQDSAEQKSQKVEQVMQNIQEQLATVKEQLPKVSGKAVAAKTAGENADQAGRVLTQAKAALPKEMTDLSEKLTEAVDAADKASTQALEILAQSEASREEILAKLGEKIQLMADKIKIVEQRVGQATSTAVANKFPINAVLIMDQSEKIEALLDQAMNSLSNNDFSGALEAYKVANELYKGAEKIAGTVENQPLLSPTPTPSQNATTSDSAGQ